jgi:hypothetical protein
MLSIPTSASRRSSTKRTLISFNPYQERVKGRAIAQAVSRRLPTAPARVEARSVHMGFVVDTVALGQVLSEYFSFHCQFLFHRLLHNHHLSSGASTIGQLVADIKSGLSFNPLQETKKKKTDNYIWIIYNMVGYNVIFCRSVPLSQYLL